MYEKAVRAMAKQRVALDVLSYHAAAPQEDVDRFKVRAQTDLNIPSSQQYDLYSYDFNDFHLDDNDTLKACIRIHFDDVSFTLQDGEMKNILGALETLALLVGCLCHDLDHRGTNNQFQIKTMSPLAQLYSTSVMEHHHFDQCIMILNTKGSEILSNLTQEQYERVLQVLESAILATDLALYFRYRGEFFNLVDSEQADWSIDEHRNLLRNWQVLADEKNKSERDEDDHENHNKEDH
ncbi:hypothetical protein LSH36_26g11008 [Paralvinella palmiformis]|uniref:PDEase domain-containing protein n=1 Tax=Paralvinella palmiformis TaxID=53620 RepID=A0AAD9NGC5_9ANNE|nr:hypothetical protein LSH36_26g11008 [Paralvinella palmiformis]